MNFAAVVAAFRLDATLKVTDADELGVGGLYRCTTQKEERYEGGRGCPSGFGVSVGYFSMKISFIPAMSCFLPNPVPRGGAISEFTWICMTGDARE